MNTLKFEVYKNTLKRRNGFNPVLGEKKYTKIKHCGFVISCKAHCAFYNIIFFAHKVASDKRAVVPVGFHKVAFDFSVFQFDR